MSFEIFAGIVAILLVSLGAFGVLKPALAIGSVVVVPLLIGGIMLGTILIIYNFIRPKQVKQEAPKPPPFQEPLFQQQQQPQKQVPDLQPQPLQPVPETPVFRPVEQNTPPIVTQQPFQPVTETPVFFPPSTNQPFQPEAETLFFPPSTNQPVEFITQPVSQEEFLNWMAQNNPDMFQTIPQDMPIPDMVMPKPPKQRKPRPSQPTSTQPQTTTQPTQPPQTTTQPPQTTTQPPQTTTQSTGSSYTPAQAAEILDAHNVRRNKFGIPNLTWDPEIASFAQSWADTMAKNNRMSHSTNKKYGENVYYSMSSRGAPLSSGEKLLTSWFDEEWVDYDYTTNSCKPGKMCAHATQVVWKDTTLVGCGRGVNNNSNSEFVSCNYFKPGNMTFNNVKQKPF